MVENIDIIQAHPFQALIQAGHQILLGAPLAVWTRPHIVTGFGGDNQLIAVCGEILAENPSEVLFGGAWRRSIVVGKVKMGDAQIKGPANHSPSVFEQVVAAEIMPQA
ncbi:hypothetical protein D3C80_1599020 [compost metagenome]